MSVTKEDVINFIANMSVLELSELVKEMEEKFGVSAAAPVAVAAAGPAAAAPVVEEKTEFDVILTSAGSSKIGDNVILAGQCALVGHITLGNNCLVLARSGVTKSWPDNSILWGSPAKPVEEAKRISACVQSLPKLNETVSALKKRLAELDRS